MPKVLIVSGLARCGSSLMMRMLYAGGMPVFVTNHNSFEHPFALKLPTNNAWLAECDGKAVKVLDPQRFVPRMPEGVEAATIWTARDYHEQAKSMFKFISIVSGNPAEMMRGPERVGITNDKIVERLEASLKHDGPVAVRTMKAIGETHIVRFEDVIKRPFPAALHVAMFVEAEMGVQLDVDKMVSVVVRRSPDCYDGMLEIESLEREEGHDGQG